MTVAETLARAIAFHSAGQLPEADVMFRRVLAAQPNHAEALHRIGAIALQRGQPLTAIDLISRSLAINPLACDAFSNLGEAFRGASRLEDAERCYRKSIALKPDFATAWANLGGVLQRMNRHEQAAQCCRQAIAFNPRHATAFNNLAASLDELGRHDEAEAAYRQAIAIDPRFIPAIDNLGALLQRQLRLNEAIPLHETVIRIEPTYAGAHKNLGLALLLTGDLARGLVEYDWRLDVEEHKVDRPAQRQTWWDGSPLNGRSIVLVSEQGFGDTIQFVRYAPLVKARRAGRVVLWCQPQLAPLLAGVSGVDEIVPRDRPLPMLVDAVSPLLSLPRALGTTLETIPKSDFPYLHAPAEPVAKWAERLGPRGAGECRVGLSWAGSPSHKNDAMRSMSPVDLEPLVNLPGITFVSLQKIPPAAATGPLPAGLRLVDHTAELNDFADTAALVANLDLVISVDTAVIHVAGALGKPAWAMLAVYPDWRWMLDRQDSPWYPTLRLFRQQRRGEWKPVVAQVRQELSLWNASKKNLS